MTVMVELSVAAFDNRQLSLDIRGLKYFFELTTFKITFRNR
jgi:hypothetical protein